MMIWCYLGIGYSLWAVMLSASVLGFTSNFSKRRTIRTRQLLENYDRYHLLQPPQRIQARDSMSPLSSRDPSSTNGNNELNDVSVEQEGEREKPVIKTLEGGTNLIFEMARKFLIWDSEFDFGEKEGEKDNGSYDGSAETKKQRRARKQREKQEAEKKSLMDSIDTAVMTAPRWRPESLVAPTTDLIANQNPVFRQASPKITAEGYAKIIRRNSRKRQPSMWRYALRTFKKMKGEEEEEIRAMLHMIKNGIDNGKPRKLYMRREIVHFEGALVACSKLGLWEDALGIYNEVEKLSLKGKKIKKDVVKRRLVTDNMVLSTITACVRASRGMKMSDDVIPEFRDTEEVEQRQKRKIPLDAARDILSRIEENHNIPVVSRHINPLASAYLACGFLMESEELLRSTLSEVTDADPTNPDRFNINDIKAKDEASYALLVKGAVSKDDWSSAVGALRDMTEKGVYPGSRSLNSWQEAAEKKERSLNFFRRSNGKKRRKSSGGGWRKKRDESFVNGSAN